MATINGTNNADTLYGTGEADIINGRGGDDTIKGMGGADRIDGGAGIDTVIYGDSTVGVGVNLKTGAGFGGTAEGDTFVNVENVFGSAQNDSLIGNDVDNVLTGLGGNDVLKGGGGSDTLQGDDGDDIMKGGGGNDFLIGGTGNDTADFSDADVGYRVSLAQGLSSRVVALGDIPPDAIEDHLSGIENITGTPFDDVLVGDAGVNGLRGGAGGDVVDGGAGADFLYPGADTDTALVDNAGDVVMEYAGEGDRDLVVASVSYTLTAGSEVEALAATQGTTTPINLTGNEFNNFVFGNLGNNVLDGGVGNDTLIGEDGLDTLIGNVGADTFLWRTIAEAGLTIGEADVIADFNRAAGDIIDVHFMDANETATGDQAFTSVQIGGMFTAPGQIIVQNNGVDTFLLFNYGCGRAG
jgi:Ca2+-binding RTX toxin-like protein